MSKWDETVGIYDYAKAMKRSYKHIYEQIRLGKIPAKRVPGGARGGLWRIPKQFLDAALTARK